MIIVRTVVVAVPLCKGEYDTCVYNLELEMDGTFMSCDNCHDYLEISNGNVTRKSCPYVDGWGFNVATRKCEYRSPNCFECNGRLHYYSPALPTTFTDTIFHLRCIYRIITYHARMQN